MGGGYEVDAGVDVAVAVDVDVGVDVAVDVDVDVAVDVAVAVEFCTGAPAAHPAQNKAAPTTPTKRRIA